MSAKGERKDQILQVLAQMLEEPRAVKITTAALAAKLEVSEAALYRHFASKAQMFEGLIEFIEATLFSLINKLTDEEKRAIRQIEGIMALLLGFASKNPGMTRVLIGDALINENERLQIRINQLHDRLEATLKQALRFGVSDGETSADVDVVAEANLLMCYVTGRWHQFAKSGYKRDPMEHWEAQTPGAIFHNSRRRIALMIAIPCNPASSRAYPKDRATHLPRDGVSPLSSSE